MAQPLLHDREQFGIVGGFGIDQAFMVEPDLGEPGGEQIAPPHHPQHRSPCTRGDSGEEQGGGAIIGHVARSRGDLVQRVEAQPAIGEPRIDRRESEGQGRAAAETFGLHGAQLRA